MLSWGTITYGAALSAALTAVAVAVADRARDIRPASWGITSAVAGGAAFAGPFAWNAILRAAHGDDFFVDAPVSILPASWQDTGSGVFTLAAAAVLLGMGPLANASGRRLVVMALVAALVAFLVDVYLY